MHLKRLRPNQMFGYFTATYCRAAREWVVIRGYSPREEELSYLKEKLSYNKDPHLAH